MSPVDQLLEEIRRIVREELERARCDHEWVSTHNPPHIYGGFVCPKCGAIKGS